MKVILTFKTPDVMNQLEDREVAEAVIEKFLEYGEILTVEFDTETQTARVLAIT